ncbi:MAG TPA: DUF3047 domain-containing protein [Spirochaetia bacterium]|nr:DUF3047 domain-containing protein [Spirochaetia bacterium]
MRTVLPALALLLCLCAGAAADVASLGASAGAEPRPSALTVVIDDFERFTPPIHGSTLRSDAWSVIYDKGRTTIDTVSEAAPALTAGSSRVLRIHGESNSYDIAHEVPFHWISQYPVLRWKWKVTQFPVGADISDLSRDDSAAQIYVNFDLKASFLFYPDLLSICYYYGSTEPDGHVFLWEGYGTFVEFICIRTVPKDGIGVWFAEERDVLRDYRKVIQDFSTDPDTGMRAKFLKAYAHALGAPPRADPARDPELEVHSVALWVDSNDTRSTAESLWDDITFSAPAPGSSSGPEEASESPR